MARTEKAISNVPRSYSAEEARQGEIVLTTRTPRLIFIGGLVLAAAVAVLLRLFA
jgi:hypothetical protein